MIVYEPRQSDLKSVYYFSLFFFCESRQYNTETDIITVYKYVTIFGCWLFFFLFFYPFFFLSIKSW